MGVRICLKAAPMSDVTQILSAIEQGDPSAAEQLLPLVYDELRKLAAQKMAHEKPGQTLQATALGDMSRGKIRDWMQLVASGEAKLQNSGRNLRPVWTEVPIPTRREFHLGR
jgi:hypothetical protein